MQQFQQPLSKGGSSQPQTCLRPHYLNCSIQKHCSKPLSTTSSSTSSRRSSPRAPYSDVAPTDPEHITRLWEAVMSHLDHTVSLRGEKTGSIPVSESVASTSTPASTYRRRQTPPTSVSGRAKRERLLAAKVTDADFPESVLEPYGITIRQAGIKKDLQKFFDIMDLPNEPKERLCAYKGLFPHDVWLDPNIQHMNREYKAMQTLGSNEAEYYTYALRYIFPDTPYHASLPWEETEKRWLPVRLLQFVCKPPQNQWHAPPNISPLTKRYEWDIRPDCAYYLSLQAFKSGLRSDVQEHTSVAQKRAFCPYLTIEFNRDENNLATARHQVAIASAMALYNRYRLKDTALRMNKNGWSDEHKNQMRHYGITFAASNWKLWCTVPKTFPEWTGCTMLTIHSGDCCIPKDAEKLVTAINDNHYWGLQIHGKSCKSDVFTRIRSDPQADYNNVYILDSDPNNVSILDDDSE
ncbi:hypothetical protein F4777DRAFT_557945 [Nemania sp. FL0916]|nr:hypothetical protein F4777DRAFT_557945 [Nemania sp. FL0916]